MDVVSINAFLPIRVSLITSCCYIVLQYVCSKSTLLLGTFVKLRKRLLASSCLFVRPTVILSVRVDNLAPKGWIFIQFHFEYFSKLCPETSSFNKVELGYRVLYVKPNIHFWSYRAHLFLEGDTFRAKCVEKIQTKFCIPPTFFKTCRLWDKILRCRTGHRWQYNTSNSHCMLDT